MTGWGAATVTAPDGTVTVLPGLGDPVPDVWCSMDAKAAYGTVNGLAFCHDDIVTGRASRFVSLSDNGKAGMALSWAIKNGGAS